MDMETLWAGACDLLQQEVASVSYETWIGDNLAPIRIEEDCLLLVVKLEAMRDFVVKQYQQVIDRCLTRAANRSMRAELRLRRELEARTTAADTGRKDEPRLNPKYTFDRFVVGNANLFAHAAALAVAENPAEVEPL